MGRLTRIALALVISVGCLSVVGPAGAASTAGSGREHFHGFLIATGAHGSRKVIATSIVARGVFDGVGRIKEVAPRPGDPENLDRDVLIFKPGRLYLRSRTSNFEVHLNRKSCKVRVIVSQTTRFAGGTGIFAGARGSGSGGVRAVGVLRRNAQGGCALRRPPLLEIDRVFGSGTLTF
jgi:hypothetical protein